MNNYILEAGPKMNRATDVVQRYKTLMTDAGFENITEVVYKWPSNGWPRDKRYKELGWWSLANFDEGLEGMVMALFTRVLGWSPTEVTVFLVKVREDLRNKNLHTYWPM